MAIDNLQKIKQVGGRPTVSRSLRPTPLKDGAGRSASPPREKGPLKYGCRVIIYHSPRTGKARIRLAANE